MRFKRNDNPEDRIHRRVVAHLRAAGLGPTDFFHCPNGGVTSKREAALRKARGVSAGVPDLIFSAPDKWGDCFDALELKAPGGRMSPAQIKWRDAYVERGGTYECVGGDAKTEDEAVDQALAVLRRWGYVP